MLKITFCVFCVQEQDHQAAVCIIFTLSFTSQKQGVSSKLHLQLDFSVWITCKNINQDQIHLGGPGKQKRESKSKEFLMLQ